MGTVLEFYGIKIKVNAKDHAPPHCHVEARGRVARFDLVAMDWMESEGFSKRDLERLKEFITARRETILDVWREYHE